MQLLCLSLLGPQGPRGRDSCSDSFLLLLLHACIARAHAGVGAVPVALMLEGHAAKLRPLARNPRGSAQPSRASGGGFRATFEVRGTPDRARWLWRTRSTRSSRSVAVSSPYR